MSLTQLIATEMTDQQRREQRIKLRKRAVLQRRIDATNKLIEDLRAAEAGLRCQVNELVLQRAAMDGESQAVAIAEGGEWGVESQDARAASMEAYLDADQTAHPAPHSPLPTSCDADDDGHFDRQGHVQESRGVSGVGRGEFGQVDFSEAD